MLKVTPEVTFFKILTLTYESQTTLAPILGFL